MDSTASFVRLWTRHQAEVERYVATMLPRATAAAEVLQDVSVRLWEKWAEYDEQRPFVPWAIGFAYLEVLKWRQRQACERLVFSDALLEQIHTAYEDEAPLMEARRRALDGCLKKLSTHEQRWVMRRYERHGALQPVDQLLKGLDIKCISHNMSHYNSGERKEASQKRDTTQSEMPAGLIDQLKATKEADDSTLFDHNCLAYGSNIRSQHYLDNCPTVLTGRGANLKLGYHLVQPKDTPLCNVWLTMLHGLGVKAERHGDSTGVVKERQA